MLRVLFVCTGNTCRSPMAAGILADLLARQDAGVEIEVASAGVAAAEGSPATPEAVAACEEIGIALRSHRARQVDARLIQQSDLVLAMEDRHRLALMALAPGAAGKIHQLSRYALGPAGQDVSDPIGQGMARYRETRDLLRRLMVRVRERLAEGKPGGVEPSGETDAQGG